MLETMILASSDNDATAWLMAAPPAVASAIWYFIYKYYRNKDKRYKYEHETVTKVKDKKAFDQKVDHRTGLKSKYIRGHNSDKHTDRVRRVPIGTDK